MARFIGIVFVFIAMVLLQVVAAQKVHVVGGSLGWNVPTGGAAAYTNWAKGKTFTVGDILEFNFTTNAHDVLRVQKSSFDACTSTNAIGDTITTGPANVTLTTPGKHYYICTIGNHCQSGQKLAIKVSGTPGASPPSKTPTPATPTAPTTPNIPSPSSKTNPAACAPTPSPGPTGSKTTGTSGPTTPPPPPASSASNALANIFASILAITLASLF